MMRILFVILILGSISARSQDCALKRDVDNDNQPRLTTGFLSFGKGSTNFLLSMDAGKKDIDFFFEVRGMGPKCFNEESIIMVMFDDGKTKMELKNTGATNCNSVMHVTFRNGMVTHAYLQRLSTKRVATIHIVGNDKAIDINFNEADKTLMQNSATCVAKESKTLL